MPTVNYKKNIAGICKQTIDSAFFSNDRSHAVVFLLFNFPAFSLSCFLTKYATSTNRPPAIRSHQRHPNVASQSAGNGPNDSWPSGLPTVPRRATSVTMLMKRNPANYDITVFFCNSQGLSN